MSEQEFNMFYSELQTGVKHDDIDKVKYYYSRLIDNKKRKRDDIDKEIEKLNKDLQKEISALEPKKQEFVITLNIVKPLIDGYVIVPCEEIGHDYHNFVYVSIVYSVFKNAVLRYLRQMIHFHRNALTEALKDDETELKLVFPFHLQESENNSYYCNEYNELFKFDIKKYLTGEYNKVSAANTIKKALYDININANVVINEASEIYLKKVEI